MTGINSARWNIRLLKGISWNIFEFLPIPSRIDSILTLLDPARMKFKITQSLQYDSLQRLETFRISICHVLFFHSSILHVRSLDVSMCAYILIKIILPCLALLSFSSIKVEKFIRTINPLRKLLFRSSIMQKQFRRFVNAALFTYGKKVYIHIITGNKKGI